MDTLEQYWKDKFSPAELVEHIGISMEDLLFCIGDWVEENLDQFRDDIEEIYGYTENSE